MTENGDAQLELAAEEDGRRAARQMIVVRTAIEHVCVVLFVLCFFVGTPLLFGASPGLVLLCAGIGSAAAAGVVREL